MLSKRLGMIGAFAPSSKSLANEMLRFVGQKSRQRILEVGAGTGAITKHLIPKAGQAQRIDAVEIMQPLFAILKRRFADSPHISLHNIDILDFKADDSYDIIISSLPFNSLPAEKVDEIIKKLISMANEGALLSFFEYKGLQRFMPFVASKDKLTNFTLSRRYIEKFISQYQVEETWVHLNFPPALVHHLRIESEVF
jgi:phosphatidylethanolamine/phosphatidyl-N-methylethanolamine N-methyltransferase